MSGYDRGKFFEQSYSLLLNRVQSGGGPIASAKKLQLSARHD